LQDADYDKPQKTFCGPTSQVCKSRIISPFKMTNEIRTSVWRSRLRQLSDRGTNRCKNSLRKAL
jgi:hypothetical protein